MTAVLSYWELVLATTYGLGGIIAFLACLAACQTWRHSGVPEDGTPLVTAAFFFVAGAFAIATCVDTLVHP